MKNGPNGPECGMATPRTPWHCLRGPVRKCAIARPFNLELTKQGETHMRISNWVSVAIIGSMLGGCATSYQSNSFAGGFKETQLAPDVFRVSFSGNAFTSPDRVQDFALLRAAELALANGAQYFAVISSADQSRTGTYVSPGSSYTTGNVTTHGNTAQYSGTTTYTAPQVHTYYKPGVGMMIRIFSAKPDGGFAFDANFIAKSIRTKYGIK
jgi:hypothetical protein